MRGTCGLQAGEQGEASSSLLRGPRGPAPPLRGMPACTPAAFLTHTPVRGHEPGMAGKGARRAARSPSRRQQPRWSAVSACAASRYWRWAPAGGVGQGSTQPCYDSYKLHERQSVAPLQLTCVRSSAVAVRRIAHLEQQRGIDLLWPAVQQGGKLGRQTREQGSGRSNAGGTGGPASCYSSAHRNALGWGPPLLQSCAATPQPPHSACASRPSTASRVGK